jgi:stalled ribosome rescue protein Dom34
MKTIKQLGIYLDHAAANLIDFTNSNKEPHAIISDFDIQDKHETLQRSENEMHHKEQDKQRAYFKKIAAMASDFNELLLFGPTTAKTELLHFLQKGNSFGKIKIDTQNTTELTIPQQQVFIREHFKKFDFKNS